MNHNMENSNKNNPNLELIHLYVENGLKDFIGKKFDEKIEEIKKEKNKVDDLLSGMSNNKKQSNQNINVFTDNNFDFGFDENIKKRTSIIKGNSNSIYQNNQQNTQTNKQTNFDDIFNTGNNGQKSNKSNTNTFDDIFS